MYLIMCNFTSYFSLGVYHDLTVPTNSNCPELGFHVFSPLGPPFLGALVL